MRALTRSPLSAIAAAAAMMLTAGTADAACKKMGFLVNDYGKEGPANDAKNLLDKHVAEWAAENGIKDYTIGKKDVKCELYIDVILFDEYTCTASANVCWDEPGKEKPAKSANTEKKSSQKTATDEKPVEAKVEKTAATPGEAPAEKTAEEATEAAPAAAIETGTLATEDAAPAAPVATSADTAAERAAAAAERAAEAAERAAAAAEKAAAASKAAAPSQLEMPAFGAGKPADDSADTPAEPKS